MSQTDDVEADLYSSIHWEQQPAPSQQEEIVDPLSETIKSPSITSAKIASPKSPFPQPEQSNKDEQSRKESINKALPIPNAPRQKQVGDDIVQVINPEKVGDGVRDAYIAYTVQMNDPNNRRPPVKRRYGDFEWLKSALERDFAATPIPPLPSKQRTEYLDRFNVEFIERRQLSLQRFLWRILIHPTLSKSKIVETFLYDKDWAATHVNDKKEGVLEGVSDTIINAFTKVKQKDDRFTAIRSHAEKLEANLNDIEKVGAKVTKRQSDLVMDFEDLNSSLTELGNVETDLRVQLDSFGRTLLNNGAIMKEFTKREERCYLANLHEFSLYSKAVLHVLKTRDHKQAEVEQLAEFLASTQAEKESMESGKGRKGSITGYLKQKIDDVKGIDTQQRIAKLGNKITELQEASVTENADVLEFNSTLMRDWEVWKSLKIQDFKSFMLEHIDNQIHSNQQMLQNWTKLLPVLEGAGVP